MKKNSYLSVALSVCLTLPAMAATATGYADATRLSSSPFQFAPKAKAELVKEGLGNPTIGKQSAPSKQDGSFKVSALKSIDLNVGQTATLVNYLDGPNNETWYYVGDYVRKDGTNISGFSIDIYDATWTKVGTVRDDIELAENETRVSEVQIGPAVTQKFFNTDDNYEVMVSVAVNTTEYVNHTYTLVYSVTQLDDETKSNCLQKFEGYYISAIDAAKDSWSENYYITFLTEEDAETTEINEVINVSDYRFITYKKADYKGNHAVVLDCRIPMITLPGADAVPFLATVVDGVPYFTTNELKYSWYLDPYDPYTDTPTPDNELVVKIYAPESSYTTQASLYSTTRFPLGATDNNYQFLYVGTFQYNGDIDMSRNEDGTPSILLTRAHSHQGGDIYTYDYEVYDGAKKGEDGAGTLKYIIATDVDGGYFMSDVAGFDPQVMFLVNDDGLYSFQFVNILTGEVEQTISQNFNDGNPKYSMNTQVDRIAHKNSYLYVIPQTTGFTGEDGKDHVYVVFASPEGDVVSVDDINMGTGVEYASIFSDATAFNPYLFNLDSDREYMLLIKRRSAVSGRINEEFSVISANPEKGILTTAGPSETLGNISIVELSNATTDNPKLLVVYNLQTYGNWQYTVTYYDLPLVRFEAGDGTAENPYEITTVGGLMQIKSAPNACFAVVNDIDADGVVINQNTFNFTGVLDGRDHIISNLSINGHALLPRVSGAAPTVDGEGNASATESNSGIVKNLKFYNAKLSATAEAQGLIVGQLSSGKVNNVHLYNSTVTSIGNVGGIVGGADSFSFISESSFRGHVETTEDNSVGGIVCSTATNSAVSACYFAGTIVGGSEVGGILGSVGSNGLGAKNCHVDADITAQNIIGGIVGRAANVPFCNNHVQGTLTATECVQWGGGAQVGGIAGDLPMTYGEADSNGEEDSITEPAPVIYNNYVNLTSITAPDAGEGKYATQNTTVHRVVGSSRANKADMVDYDTETWQPIYGDPYPAEVTIKNNYVNSALAIIDSTIADHLDSTEGKSIDTSELSQSFFQENLSLAYGNEEAAPWSLTSTTSPSLYFEEILLLADPTEVTITKGEEVAINVIISGAEIDYDLVSGFLCDYDEALLEMVNMDFAENGLLLVFSGLEAGETNISLSLYGKAASVHVTVLEKGGVEEVLAQNDAQLSYNGSTLVAEGSAIEVYNLSGVKLLAGYETVSTDALAAGVYVAVAKSANGVSTLKICVK